MLERNAAVLGVDVVLISEPYRQLVKWHNDASGGASIWVRGYNGWLPDLAHPIELERVVAVPIWGKLCVSAYCPPSLNLKGFRKYADAIEAIIAEARASGLGIIFGGDLNARSPAWGGSKVDRRGQCCLDLLSRQGLIPSKGGRSNERLEPPATATGG